MRVPNFRHAHRNFQTIFFTKVLRLQGLRWDKKRSILMVCEHFCREHNAAIAHNTHFYRMRSAARTNISSRKMAREANQTKSKAATGQSRVIL